MSKQERRVSAEINEFPSPIKPTHEVAPNESNALLDREPRPLGDDRTGFDGNPDATPRRQPIRLFAPRRTEIYFLRR